MIKIENPIIDIRNRSLIQIKYENGYNQNIRYPLSEFPNYMYNDYTRKTYK